MLHPILPNFLTIATDLCEPCEPFARHRDPANVPEAFRNEDEPGIFLIRNRQICARPKRVDELMHVAHLPIVKLELRIMEVNVSVSWTIPP